MWRNSPIPCFPYNWKKIIDKKSGSNASNMKKKMLEIAGDDKHQNTNRSTYRRIWKEKRCIWHIAWTTCLSSPGGQQVSNFLSQVYVLQSNFESFTQNITGLNVPVFDIFSNGMFSFMKYSLSIIQQIYTCLNWFRHGTHGFAVFRR